MVSERLQRRIDHLLDQAEEAADREDWGTSATRAKEALAYDDANEDAKAILSVAEKMQTDDAATSDASSEPAATTAVEQSHPSSFVAGRYRVERFLGEGGRKRVFLAHDTTLDRDVAFAQIRTEGLDDLARERVMREAHVDGAASCPTPAVDRSRSATRLGSECEAVKGKWPAFERLHHQSSSKEEHRESG